MNARRKHRVFLDHKPPLVAFVLILVTSMVLLVHMARSEAAPAWLRHGVSSVMAGGAPLTQRVVSSHLLEPTRTAPQADPPAVEVPNLSEGAAAAGSEAPAAPESSPSSSPSSSASSHAAHPQAAGPGAAVAAAPVDHGPGAHPTAAGPSSPSTPDHPGRGPRGHGVTNVPNGATDEQGPSDPEPPAPSEDACGEPSDDPSEDPSAEPSEAPSDDDCDGTDDPVRGDGDAEHGQHPWYGEHHGHGHHGHHGGHHGDGHHGDAHRSHWHRGHWHH